MLALAVLGIVGASSLAACGGHQHSTRASAAPSASPATASPTAADAAPAAVSPLTGLPATAKPVTAVKVDNVSVEPQTGLNDADVVYCELVEGGLTRLLALYSSRTPTSVGPVRSARTSDIELLAQYGRVALAYSGANSGVLASVRAANLQDDGYDAHPGFYHFDPARVSPYRFLVNIASVVAAAPGVRAKDVGFRFGAAPAAGTGVREVSVRYPSTTIAARWDAASGRWLLSRNGRSLRLTDGGQANASDVLVQYVQIGASKYVDSNHNVTPTSATVGSGSALLFRDGHRYAGSWSRASKAAPTTWTARGGGSLSLAPGRVWVLLAPAGAPTVTN